MVTMVPLLTIVYVADFEYSSVEHNGNMSYAGCEMFPRIHVYQIIKSQMLHVWNIYLHLPQKWPKCR